MSESSFDFIAKPFSSVPDADCFIALAQYEEALQHLAEWVGSGEGVAMLTGSAGLGKTLICQRLLADISAEKHAVLLPHGNFPHVQSFLKALLFQLNCNYAGLDEDELRLELGRVLQNSAEQQGGLLLVIDGAHEMSESLLQQIQTLVAEGEKIAGGLMILLSGQLELEELLTRRSLSGLNQRMRSHQILEPLTRMESADYLAGRIEWAGSDIEAVMTEEAVELMTHLSDGVPRCLNRIAETSLRVAVNHHAQAIDGECVREAFEDVRHLPLHWNAWPEDEANPEVSSADEMSAAEEETEDASIAGSITNGAPVDRDLAQSVPDLKSEAEEAGVEYVVAEFGGDEDDSEDTPAPDMEKSETEDSEESCVEVPELADQNGENGVDDSSNLTSEQERAPLHPMRELVEMVDNSNSEVAADAQPVESGAKQTRTDAARKDYLQSRLNPVDIFAVDLPEEQPILEESYSEAAGVATATQVDAQKLIADEVQKVVEQDDSQQVEDQGFEQAQQYDVIEPEAIPDLSKTRPSFELDLPHREPQPRYRNLFRDLRRRRG
ncbi:MAG: AAA family ATPase [Planctomycetaceae bacterium]|nr:AAA family ATPase [Planctomycetaceae bacterium]